MRVVHDDEAGDGFGPSPPLEVLFGGELTRAIVTLGKQGRLPRLLALLELARTSPKPITTISFNAAITAACRCGDPDAALALLEAAAAAGTATARTCVEQ